MSDVHQIISGHATVAGVMGWPINHSKSPRIHNYWLRRYGIDGAYIPFPVETQHFEAALQALPYLGIKGVNITIPHKQHALKIVNHVHPLAARVGAVNTIIVRQDGTLEGRNTDVFGFMENLRFHNVELKDKVATVLGSGGAARAILVALMDMGCGEIRIVNRSQHKAEELKGEMKEQEDHNGLHVYGWDEIDRALSGASFVVNTTSLGMTGQPPLEIDLSRLPYDACVNDIVYSPLMTGILKQAQQKGLKIVDGLGMLLHQARPGFAAWFGKDPEVSDDLRHYVLGA